MKVHLSLLIAVWVTAVCALEAADSPPAKQQQLQLPRVFDFVNFKRLFQRTYGSIVEHSVRQSLYLARAFRVFISCVWYKRRQQSYYLGINEMSDRTTEEIQRTHLRVGKLKPAVAASETELADENLIRRELVGAIKRRASDRTAAQIAQELETSRRKKREAVGQDRRFLSVDELAWPSPSELSEPVNEKQVRYVPSNNPDYEAPDLMSFGLESPDFLVDRMPEPKVNDLNKRCKKLVYPLKPKKAKRRKKGKQAAVEKPPDEVFIDHRQSKCLLAPRSQMDCSSCYIFPVIALYEWLYCMQTGHLVAFSEQYPLECGNRTSLDGCHGGYLENVFDFNQQYGLALRRDYTYNDQPGECPYHAKVPPRSMGYIRADDIERKLVRRHELDEALEDSPVAITIAVHDRFHEYGGGVDDGKGCKKDWVHAVLLVGSGREDGVEYYLLRNSYGLTYGEAGHLKLDKNSHCIAQDDECFTAEGAFSKDREQNLNQHHRADCYNNKRLELLEQSLKSPLGVVDRTV